MKKVYSFALLALLASACTITAPSDPGWTAVDQGGDGNTPTAVQLTPIASNSSTSWLIGDWQLNRSPVSYGDVGSDPQSFHISATEIWVEKFGHLASENYSFNTDGYDYGGNCRYRIHSTYFGLDTDQLVIYPSTYELISDSGNRSDCDQQISRMNQVNTGTYEKAIGTPVSIDATHFSLVSPVNTLQINDETFIYNRIQ
jgi:hypothetical protein